LIELLFFSECF